MLRDKNLVPLSHQHQHALALCVRIERASPIPDEDLPRWLEEVALHFRSEIAIHFVAEEKVLFPKAREFPELGKIVEDLLADHAALRTHFLSAESKEMSAEGLRDFAAYLSAHIRKEERELFERLQKLMSPQELAAVGTHLNLALQGASSICVLPAARKTKR